MSSQYTLQVDARQQRLVKTVRPAWEGAKAEPEEEQQSRPAKLSWARERSATPAALPPAGASPKSTGEAKETAAASRNSGGNGPLFDALLMAAQGEPILQPERGCRSKQQSTS